MATNLQSSKAKKKKHVRRIKRVKRPKPNLSFTPNKVKGEIFYVHVQPENKKYAAAAAEKTGISMSEWTDQLLTQVRTKKLM